MNAHAATSGQQAQSAVPRARSWSLASRAVRKARLLARSWRRPATVQIDGITVGVDYANWSAKMIGEVLSERYEHEERKVLPKMLRSDDRVLEIGGAIGLISMLSARFVGAENVFVYEANPAVLACAEENYRLNGVTPEIRHAAAVGNGFDGESVSFFVHENFWASSLLKNDNSSQRIEAPAIRIGELLEKHAPTVLIMDVEGAEHDILAGADLSSLRAICIEVHTRYIGIERANRVLSSVLDQGFLLDLESSVRECLCFVKAPA